MAVFDDLQKLVGTPYNRGMYNSDLIDMLVLRRAKDKGFRLPTAVDLDIWNFFGAYVFLPRAGINRNVMYLDLASLYPNLMRALNVGPTTIIGSEADLEKSQYTVDDCYWSWVDYRPVKHLEKGESYRDFTDGKWKMVYDPDASGTKTKWKDEPSLDKCYFLKPSIKEGFLKEIIEELIDLKYQYEGSMYEAVKRVVNSVYGWCSPQNQSNSSRLADWRIGESITMAGRKIIQYTARTAVKMLDEKVNGEVYIAIGDTDGCGLCWPSAPSREVMSNHVEDIVNFCNGEGYDQFMADEFGITETDHYQELENESYAPSLFVPEDTDATDEMIDEHLLYSNNNSTDVAIGTKKRYAQWITIDEDEEVDKIKIKGMEAVRSDVADVTVDSQKQILEWLLKKDFNAAMKEIAPFLREKYEPIKEGEYPIGEIAKRGGISKPITEYGSAKRTPQPIYKGAKFADKFIDGETIRDGSKPMAFYVDNVGDQLPSTYDADTAEDGDVVDTISVEDPSNLPSGVTIDYEKHLEKSLVDPIEPILETVGSDWDEVIYEHKQSGLEAF